MTTTEFLRHATHVDLDVDDFETDGRLGLTVTTYDAGYGQHSALTDKGGRPITFESYPAAWEFGHALLMARGDSE